jgi:hypothetical protein
MVTNFLLTISRNRVKTIAIRCRQGRCDQRQYRESATGWNPRYFYTVYGYPERFRRRQALGIRRGKVYDKADDRLLGEFAAPNAEAVDLDQAGQSWRWAHEELRCPSFEVNPIVANEKTWWNLAGTPSENQLERKPRLASP